MSHLGAGGVGLEGATGPLLAQSPCATQRIPNAPELAESQVHILREPTSSHMGLKFCVSKEEEGGGSQPGSDTASSKASVCVHVPLCSQAVCTVVYTWGLTGHLPSGLMCRAGGADTWSGLLCGHHLGFMSRVCTWPWCRWAKLGVSPASGMGKPVRVRSHLALGALVGGLHRCGGQGLTQQKPHSGSGGVLPLHVCPGAR